MSTFPTKYDLNYLITFIHQRTHIAAHKSQVHVRFFPRISSYEIRMLSIFLACSCTYILNSLYL